MTGREAVEIVKKVNGNVAEDVLFRALERLEIMIEKYTKREHREFDAEATLYACGGDVCDGYDDMYTLYLKREAALQLEDRDCYASYDAMFALRWSEFMKEFVRGHKSENQSFSPDWRW
jgi:hypothetical protein